ncbi:MAG: hypothetical protein IPK71_07015 [Myxococcales bacterium]|nr:hypothetical protein [Myxococcales bacterium]
MKRALVVGSLVILVGLVSSTFACSSESSSATPSDCEAAFNKLCDKAASCTPTGKVTFISPSSGDAGGDAGGGGGSLSMKSAADCKILYGSSCSSQPPANIPACAAAAESAQCTTRATGEGALAFPAACQ